MEIDTVFAPIVTVNYQFELAAGEWMERMNDSETSVWVVLFRCI